MQQHTFGIAQGCLCLPTQPRGEADGRPASDFSTLPSTAWSCGSSKAADSSFLEVVGAVGGRPLVGHVQLGWL